MVSKRTEHQLKEDFRGSDRSPAEYAFPLEGMELAGDACRDLLKEFSRSERPVLSLHLPGGEEAEPGPDFAVSKLRRHTMSLADPSPAGETFSFLREHSRVRFGFEHRGGVCVFETRVLGSAGEQGAFLLAERPERIYVERRSNRRYRIRTDIGVFLGWMPVQEISWSGLRMVSETAFEPGDRLEWPQLSLPRVRDRESGADLCPGGNIRVPQAVVKYMLNQDARSHYGVCFEWPWPEEQAQELATFLRALRRRRAKLPEGG
jgi:hypothetical protein